MSLKKADLCKKKIKAYLKNDVRLKMKKRKASIFNVVL